MRLLDPYGEHLGRSFEEIQETHRKFSTPVQPDKFIRVIYWLGKLALEEELTGEKRTITFSTLLRERLGHHIHGERWANTIKDRLHEKGLLGRPSTSFRPTCTAL